MPRKIEEYKKLLENPNVKAYLQTIRDGEGTLGEQGYYTFVGGTRFTDLSHHPNVYFKRFDSTAAGAYQFAYKTWAEVAKALKLKDFSPLNQDIAALYELDRVKALTDVINGDIAESFYKSKKTWLSLPGAKHDKINRHSLGLSEALTFYQQQGGTLSENDLNKIYSGHKDFVSVQNTLRQLRHAFDRPVPQHLSLHEGVERIFMPFTGLDKTFLPNKPGGAINEGSKKTKSVHLQDGPENVRLYLRGPLIGNLTIKTDTQSAARDSFRWQVEDTLLEILDTVNAR